jgi:hypothetical protein
LEEIYVGRQELGSSGEGLAPLMAATYTNKELGVARHVVVVPERREPDGEPGGKQFLRGSRVEAFVE